MNDSLSPETEVTYPWTVMVKSQAANPTDRTMIGSRRLPLTIATIFVADSKVSMILVNALVGLSQGFFFGHLQTQRQVERR